MKKYCLTLAVVTAMSLLAISADAKHVLADIDTLHITIIHPDQEPNTDGLIWERLKAQINNLISQAGIKVFSPSPDVIYKLPIWPELKIKVDMLKLKDSQQYVFHIQTLLAKNIYLQVKPPLRQKADVWQTEPVMQIAAIKNMPAKITEIVLQQVNLFIQSYNAAKAQPTQAPDVNDTTTVTKSQTKTVKSEAIQYEYIASKNSQVFHGPNCSSARRINPENLVGYNNRDEAIQAGKRPCKRCKP
ncbi:MAG: hypothetical protein JSV82_09070 [Planctomycetota bacterium]|nr:MAG: hypothetical protein JSV82_09070 [Planctomycetota bacterium]